MADSPAGIPVTDSRGDRLSVYAVELDDRVPVSGLRRTLIRYELADGEEVQFVDDLTFEVVSTAEKLLRVEND